MLNKARRVISLQVLVTAGFAAAALLSGGNRQAVSALIGGAIGFIPAWLYAWKMTAGTGSDPRTLLRAQYKAELYKFSATLLLFSLTFILFRDVSALPLFLTYLATLLVYWVALML